MQPLVRDLDLPSVADLLIEDAELVTQSIADRRDLQSCERVEIAGGEASETAVTEAGFFLELFERIQVLPERPHGLARRGLDAEIDQIVRQLWPDEKFGG